MQFRFKNIYQNKIKLQNGGVFTTAYFNPKNWGVSNYSDNPEFKDAFRKAKIAGEKEFIWNGKRYTTDFKGTPEQERRMYYPHLEGEPVTVHKYPVFSNNYVPGHLAASVGEQTGNTVAINYSSYGNNKGYIDPSEKGSEAINIFGADTDKFIKHAANLPLDDYAKDYGLSHDKSSDWNLITNNCADEVCRALDVVTGEIVTTPKKALQEIKGKYKHMDITGRTVEDYRKYASDRFEDMTEAYKRDEKEGHSKIDAILNNVDYYLQLIHAPDLPDDVKKSYGQLLQYALFLRGYQLPNSLTKEGVMDGVIGKETLNQIQKFKEKNKKHSLGGLIDMKHSKSNSKVQTNNQWSFKNQTTKNKILLKQGGILFFSDGGKTDKPKQQNDNSWVNQLQADQPINEEIRGLLDKLSQGGAEKTSSCIGAACQQFFKHNNIDASAAQGKTRFSEFNTVFSNTELAEHYAKFGLHRNSTSPKIGDLVQFANLKQGSGIYQPYHAGIIKEILPNGTLRIAHTGGGNYWKEDEYKLDNTTNQWIKVTPGAPNIGALVADKMFFYSKEQRPEKTIKPYDESDFELRFDTEELQKLLNKQSTTINTNPTTRKETAKIVIKPEISTFLSTLKDKDTITKIRQLTGMSLDDYKKFAEYAIATAKVETDLGENTMYSTGIEDLFGSSKGIVQFNWDLHLNAKDKDGNYINKGLRNQLKEFGINEKNYTKPENQAILFMLFAPLNAKYANHFFELGNKRKPGVDEISSEEAWFADDTIIGKAMRKAGASTTETRKIQGNNLNLSDAEKFRYAYYNPKLLAQGDAQGASSNVQIKNFTEYLNSVKVTPMIDGKSIEEIRKQRKEEQEREAQNNQAWQSAGFKKGGKFKFKNGGKFKYNAGGGLLVGGKKHLSGAEYAQYQNALKTGNRKAINYFEGKINQGLQKDNREKIQLVEQYADYASVDEMNKRKGKNTDYVGDFASQQNWTSHVPFAQIGSDWRLADADKALGNDLGYYTRTGSALFDAVDAVATIGTLGTAAVGPKVVKQAVTKAAQNAAKSGRQAAQVGRNVATNLKDITKPVEITAAQPVAERLGQQLKKEVQPTQGGYMFTKEGTDAAGNIVKPGDVIQEQSGTIQMNPVSYLLNRNKIAKTLEEVGDESVLSVTQNPFFDKTAKIVESPDVITGAKQYGGASQKAGQPAQSFVGIDFTKTRGINPSLRALAQKPSQERAAAALIVNPNFKELGGKFKFRKSNKYV